jgi:hypothetical protein
MSAKVYDCSARQLLPTCAVATLFRHFVCHNDKTRQLRGSKGRGYRDIGRVPAARHYNAPDAGMVMAGVEGKPPSVEENLEPCAEIHRRGIPGHADLAEIAGAIAGGNVHAAAQRHGEMSKIPADADALGMSFGSHAVAARVVVAEFNVVMHVVADRLHALPAAIDTAEQRPREVGKFLRVAVAAPQEVYQRFVG